MTTYNISELLKKIEAEQALTLMPGENLVISDLTPQKAIQLFSFICNLRVDQIQVAKGVLELLVSEIDQTMAAWLKKHEKKPESENIIKQFKEKLSAIRAKIQEIPIESKREITTSVERKSIPPSNTPITHSTATSSTIDHYRIIHDRLETHEELTDSEFKALKFKIFKSISSNQAGELGPSIPVYFAGEVPASIRGKHYLLKMIDTHARSYELFYKNSANDQLKKVHIGNIYLTPDAIENEAKKTALLTGLAETLDNKRRSKPHAMYQGMDLEEAVWQIERPAYNPTLSDSWYRTCKRIQYAGNNVSVEGAWCAFNPIVEPTGPSKYVGIKLHLRCAYEFIPTVLDLTLKAQNEARKIGSKAFDYFKIFARNSLDVMREDKEQCAKTFCFHLGSHPDQVATILELLVKPAMEANVPSNRFTARSDSILEKTNDLAMIRNDMGLLLVRLIDLKEVEPIQLVDDATDMAALIKQLLAYSGPSTDPNKKIFYKIIPVYVRLSGDGTQITIRSLPIYTPKSASHGAFDFSSYTLRESKNMPSSKISRYVNRSISITGIPRAGALDSPGGHFAFTRNWSEIIKLKPIPIGSLHLALVQQKLMVPVDGVRDISLTTIIQQAMRTRNTTTSTALATSLPNQPARSQPTTLLPPLPITPNLPPVNQTTGPEIDLPQGNRGHQQLAPLTAAPAALPHLLVAQPTTLLPPLPTGQVTPTMWSAQPTPMHRPQQLAPLTGAPTALPSTSVTRPTTPLPPLPTGQATPVFRK